MKAADEPAYLTVGTDVSAKYRGAFCEAKIKTVKRLVKVKVTLKEDNSTLLVLDDQVKGPLRVGATVEMKTPEGSVQEAVVSKLTDASSYTVVFDDGDERTLRRTSLCLKGERHFAESETLDQLPLTNPEHFGTPVIGKKSNRGRRSSLPMTEDEKEEESSEDEDEDQKRLNDELLGKIVSVMCNSETLENTPDWYPALVVSPSCGDDSTTVKKDQCLVRSFADSKFYSVSRRDVVQLDILNLLKTGMSSNQGLQEASFFFQTRAVPNNWKMDMSEILESSSSEEDDVEAEGSEDEKNKGEEEETLEVVPEEEPDPEERDNFLQQLYKFMEDRGTPINKPPVLGYKNLNLFKLFRLVYQHGGCDKIDSGAVWKQIYMDLGIPILNSAASYNVKTAYRKYLYGFEEYCRSANIQFRTIHHNDPKPAPVEQVRKVEEPMEERVQEEPEMPTVQIKKEDEESIDSSSESEKEELDLRSPRGRRKIIRDVIPTNMDNLEVDLSMDSNTENKDLVEEIERFDSETAQGRRNMPRLKVDGENKEDEESDTDSYEDDERRRECKEEAENRASGEDDGEDTDSSLTGTKVKVKYGRGKTQKIYEANIKSTEIDNGEVLYLVHYYGWNVRYDEWVKADRIIWLSDKGGPKRKQRKKTKNKEESESDEKKEEEKQKSKRGRPPLKSTLLSNLACCLSKMPNSEGKLDARSALNSMQDSSPLSNGTEGTLRRRTRHNSGMFDSDQGSNDLSMSDSESDEASEKMSVKEEFTLSVTKELEDIGKKDDLEETTHEMSLVIEENERTPTKVLETLKQEVEESEQIVQIYGNNTEKVEELKEVEKSPKVKGKRSKTKDSLEITNISLTNEDEMTESQNEPETLKPPLLESKELFLAPEEETDLVSDVTTNDIVLKRRPLEHDSPEKKMRIECEPDVPNIVEEETPDECIRIEGCKDLDEDLLENESKEMPSLTAESDQHIQDPMNEVFETPPREMDSIPYKGQVEEDDETMPHIGPETLVCHEVDLDDFDEKYKHSSEETIPEKSEPNTPASDPPALRPSIQCNISEALLALSQDESHSIKSESDITIEVDSVAEESQEGLCESESANGFEASTTSSSCSVTIQEREIKEKGQKRSSEGNTGSMAKKQKRNAKRTGAASKIEKNGTGQSSDSEDLSALDNSSKCTPNKHPNISKPQKLTRSPARVTSPHVKDVEREKHREKTQNAPPKTYKWSFPNEVLDTMTSNERITFLQDKLQEMRKYYLSLKSEVATIDRRRKRLKKKDREVTHPGVVSMSSASSETGMSPSSSSPPQNTVTVECR